MEDEPKRPLRSFVRVADRVVNYVALFLVLLLALYSAYSIWYTSSLLNGSFLSDELAMYKPNGHEPTLEELMEQNQDVHAWLTIDGTRSDYPVVQGEDDNEYLNKSVEGDFSLAGAIFLTVQNKPDFSDSYNVIYGHRIEGGAMFSDVILFREADYFNAHETGVLWLAHSAYSIEVFACMDVDAFDEVVYQNPSDVRPEMLPDLVKDITERSIQTRAVDIEADDHIIALSTCENAATFERVVIFGKLTPLSEAQMNALQLANYEEQQALEASGESTKPGLLQQNPWILPAASGFLFIVIAYVLWRIVRRNR